MKKIPTLFERKFENHRIVGISDKVTPGMEWVLNGEGIATIKVDGSCCAIIDGVFYKSPPLRPGGGGVPGIPDGRLEPRGDPAPVLRCRKPTPSTLKAGELRTHVSRCQVCMRRT